MSSDGYAVPPEIKLPAGKSTYQQVESNDLSEQQLLAKLRKRVAPLKSATTS